jgi:hypothetical protein
MRRYEHKDRASAISNECRETTQERSHDRGWKGGNVTVGATFRTSG